MITSDLAFFKRFVQRYPRIQDGNTDYEVHNATDETQSGARVFFPARPSSNSLKGGQSATIGQWNYKLTNMMVKLISLGTKEEEEEKGENRVERAWEKGEVSVEGRERQGEVG